MTKELIAIFLAAILTENYVLNKFFNYFQLLSFAFIKQFNNFHFNLFIIWQFIVKLNNTFNRDIIGFTYLKKLN